MDWRTMDEMKNALDTWHDVITPPHPPHPPFCKQQRNLQRSNIFQPSNIFQDSTSSTHLTWRYYIPPTPPHPPFCKQQRNLQRSNIFQPSNIFQDSTSSNALHMTLLHPPNIIQRTSHDVITPPPTPPSVYKNDLSGIASRLRVPRSSGEPPALSLYIYTQYTLHLDMTRDIVVLSTETWDDQQTRDLQYEPWFDQRRTVRLRESTCGYWSWKRPFFSSAWIKQYITWNSTAGIWHGSIYKSQNQSF